MLSNAATAALRDIEHHIDLANKFVTGLDYEAFREHANDLRGNALPPLRDVVSRELASLE